jgi:DNA modification methylase
LIEALKIDSPKRAGRTENGWNAFFPYYAGFPETFARSLLDSARLPAGATILDPWNGSGTTTFAASQLGYNSHGFDLNPAMIIIARARLLAPSEADSLEPLAREVTRHRGSADAPDHDDPLRSWFGPRTSAHIRGIERSICRHLVGAMTIAPDGTHIERISAIAATFYVALFCVCRTLVRRFQSSNPTWLRMPRNHEAKIGVPRELITDRLAENLLSMSRALTARPNRSGCHTDQPANCEIRLADTTSPILDPISVDMILTSPPYCTRIDYPVATRIELAVLAPLTGDSSIGLADRMIGSTHVPSREIAPLERWGMTCQAFLEELVKHRSKASSTYYYKTHLDYFDKMFRSLLNLSRTLKDGGVGILVVQDSYYKDIHNDLPRVITEMAHSAGLTLVRRENFHLRRSMSGVNPHSRIYERPSGATEAVLCLRKTS